MVYVYFRLSRVVVVYGSLSAKYDRRLNRNRTKPISLTTLAEVDKDYIYNCFLVTLMLFISRIIIVDLTDSLMSLLTENTRSLSLSLSH